MGNRCHKQQRETLKRTLQDAEWAREHGLTTQNESIVERPKAAGNGRKHTMRTGAAETKQHTAPNSPKRNLTNSVRLHPDTRERSIKSTAPTATAEAPGKPLAPERPHVPQPKPYQRALLWSFIHDTLMRFHLRS